MKADYGKSSQHIHAMLKRRRGNDGEHFLTPFCRTPISVTALKAEREEPRITPCRESELVVFGFYNLAAIGDDYRRKFAAGML
jgi:hypothetical protein